MSGSRVERVLLVLAVAYFAAVVVGVFVDYDPPALASSPSSLVNGEVWRLLTSGLAVEGRFPLFQIAVAALASFEVIRLWGPIAWWGVVLSAHVGSALVAYALIGIFDALGTESAEKVTNDLDYGVSIVVTGSLGALFATAFIRGHRRLVLLSLLGVIAVVPLTLDWYGIEHPLGFAFGAAFIVWWDRRERRATE
jgi:hypothetical protein